MGSVLCEHCTAACCRYVALPIDSPTCARDFDDMRWYVMHEDIAVFLEEGDWFIQIHTPCRRILPDGRCGIYETRPAICREYTTDDCDYHIGDETASLYFDNADALLAYAKVFLSKRKRGSNGRAATKSGRKKARRIPKGVRGGAGAPVQIGLAGVRK